ncbi:MAG: hypothetical protein VW146_06080 [Gammaproteobacteria bacterium]
MNKTNLHSIASVLFGMLISLIGFVNAYWGNDPYFGLIIIGLAFFYYLPLIDLLRRLFAPKFFYVLKIVLGILILWASLGVGELEDKLAMMLSSFPYPNITGI